jgi:hypothetical protein
MGHDAERMAILRTLATDEQKQIVNADSTEEYKSPIQFTVAGTEVTLEAYKIAAFMRSAIDTQSITGTENIFYGSSPVESFINDPNKPSAVWAALVEEFRCAVCTDFANYIYTYMIENSTKYVYFCEMQGHAFVITSPDHVFPNNERYDIKTVFKPDTDVSKDSYIVDPWYRHKLISLSNVNDIAKDEEGAGWIEKRGIINWYNTEFNVIDYVKGTSRSILNDNEKGKVAGQINELKQFINRYKDLPIEEPERYKKVVNKNLLFWNGQNWISE